MMALRLCDSRQQQQAIRGVILAQTAGQLFSAIVVPRRQRHVDGPGARILVRRIARHQVVIDHPGLFVHFAALVQPRHGEHQIGILRIALHSADQLVIRRSVIALLAQAVGFVDHIAIANARQLRRRTAGLQLRIADQVLRLAGQPGLIQDGDLIGVIPGIAGYAAADIVAHQRDRGGQVAALGQQTRQLAGVRRGFWRRGGHRPQGIAGGDGIALLIGLLGLRQLAVEQRIGRLLTTGRRGVAAEVRGPAQILRRGLVVAAALGDIAHARQRIGILGVGLQYLFKLLLRGGGIAAVEIGVALAARLTAAPFAKVILNFAVLGMPLHPGVVILLIPGLRAQPEQRLAQAAVRLFIAAGHRLEQGDPFPASLFPPG